MKLNVIIVLLAVYWMKLLSKASKFCTRFTPTVLFVLLNNLIKPLFTSNSESGLQLWEPQSNILFSGAAKYWHSLTGLPVDMVSEKKFFTFYCCFCSPIAQILRKFQEAKSSDPIFVPRNGVLSSTSCFYFDTTLGLELFA